MKGESPEASTLHRSLQHARGESRTRTGLPPADFESAASAIPPLGRAAEYHGPRPGMQVFELLRSAGNPSIGELDLLAALAGVPFDPGHQRIGSDLSVPHLLGKIVGRVFEDHLIAGGGRV